MRVQFSPVCALIVVNACVIFAQPPADLLADARKRLQKDEVNQAHDLVLKAMAQAGESPAAVELLGEVEFRQGAIAAAEADFRKALRLDAGQARAWLGLGRVFRCASFHKSARNSFRRAHDLDPRDGEIVHAWAGTLKRSERAVELEKFYKAAGESADPEDLESMRRSIDAAKELGDRKLFRLVSEYAPVEIPFLSLLYDPHRIRGFGLPVSINGGKPLKLLVDTGASGILINRKAAERAGLEKLREIKLGGLGDEGDRTGFTSLAATVKVGGVEFADCLIGISDKKSVADEEGLIGTDVFSRFLVTLDFLKRVLRLDPLPARPQAGEDEPLDREIAPDFKDYAQVFRFGHALLIRTRVSGSQPVLFMIDTGSAQTIISPDVARQVTKVRNQSDIIMKGLSGKVKKVDTTDELVLQFAGFQQRNRDMIAVDLSKTSRSFGTEISGILGLPLLNFFVLKLDYRDGLAHFDYIGPKQ